MLYFFKNLFYFWRTAHDHIYIADTICVIENKMEEVMVAIALVKPTWQDLHVIKTNNRYLVKLIQCHYLCLQTQNLNAQFDPHRPRK